MESGVTGGGEVRVVMTILRTLEQVLNKSIGMNDTLRPTMSLMIICQRKKSVTSI